MFANLKELGIGINPAKFEYPPISGSGEKDV